MTIDDFSEIEIALPKNIKQIENLLKSFINIFDEILKNSNEIKKLEKIRDILLPKLMSGEIDVSNINFD